MTKQFQIEEQFENFLSAEGLGIDGYVMADEITYHVEGNSYDMLVSINRDGGVHHAETINLEKKRKYGEDDERIFGNAREVKTLRGLTSYVKKWSSL